MMAELHCRDLEAAIASAAAILGMPPEELRHAVLIGDPSIANKPRTIESVVWFHGTRIPTSTTYREGLLPTPEMVPRFLRMLHDFAIDGRLCSEDEWQALTASLDSDLLAWKRGLGGFDNGPHGFLLREVFFDPGDIPVGDYTSEPEYLRCLRSAFPEDMSNQLLSAYLGTTRRAIVSFRSRKRLSNVVRCALEYIHTKLTDAPLHQGCNQGFYNDGQTVPAADVLGIEWLPD